jgi:hypothetical protein
MAAPTGNKNAEGNKGEKPYCQKTEKKPQH